MRMLGIEWGVVLHARDPLDMERATSWLAGVVCSSQTQKALHLTLLSILKSSSNKYKSKLELIDAQIGYFSAIW